MYSLGRCAELAGHWGLHHGLDLWEALKYNVDTATVREEPGLWPEPITAAYSTEPNSILGSSLSNMVPDGGQNMTTYHLSCYELSCSTQGTSTMRTWQTIPSLFLPTKQPGLMTSKDLNYSGASALISALISAEWHQARMTRRYLSQLLNRAIVTVTIIYISE